MNIKDFKYLIQNARYYSKYEAIIETKSQEIYGYEALSKFDIDVKLISTEEIFRKLHHYNELFFNLEKINKKRQIENYDMNKKLFLNFDPDIVVSEEQQKYWATFLITCKKDVVVEITENGSDDESSALVMRNFADWLRKHKIKVALDDFAQEGSMFSFYIMAKSNYIKIDKSFLQKIRVNKNYIPYLKGVLETIKLNNQKSIIEGVETKEDFEFVKSLDCDFMQGYYFDEHMIIK